MSENVRKNVPENGEENGIGPEAESAAGRSDGPENIADAEGSGSGSETAAGAEGREEGKKPSKRLCRDWGHGDSDNAWWEERSLPAKIAMGIGFGILGAGFIVLLIFVVMWLWNWLMPDIFGLKTINFWKAAGLMALSFILFKNIGSGNSSRKTERKRKRQLRSYMEEEA